MTALLVACALTVTGVIVRRELLQGKEVGREPTRVRNFRSYWRESGFIGPADAPVTIVAFSDFQCPYCARFAKTLDSLNVLLPGQVRWQFRHYPLSAIHDAALDAAVAAECARRSGRFKAYHDSLFADQRRIGRRPWGVLAREVGIEDSAGFEHCRAEEAVALLVRQDSVAGSSLGVNGTPTILVNQWRFGGAPTLQELRSLVEREIERTR